MKNILTLLALFIQFSAFAQSALQVDKLTCENIVNPLGIDVRKPELAWTLVLNERNQFQSAYEIIVSSDRSLADKLQGNFWSTGKVISNQQLHIEYSGTGLSPRTRYYWRVRVYNQEGKASDWSKTNWFETGMMEMANWNAKWINDGSAQPMKDEDYYLDDPMPLFRKGFTTKKKITSARLYITGLGYYEAYLNGKRVGDHELDPGFTTYKKQVFYSTYDVTALVKNGNNIAGIMLGNGWYNPLPLRRF